MSYVCIYSNGTWKGTSSNDNGGYICESTGKPGYLSIYFLHVVVMIFLDLNLLNFSLFDLTRFEG